MVKIGEQKFEEVRNFNWFGIMINNENDRRLETMKNIQAGYGAQYRSKRISKASKMRIHKIVIRPVVTYKMETMSH